MSYLVNSPEYLELDNVPLQTPAWTLENLFVLWGPANTRGTDLLIPGAAGVRPRRRRRTVTTQTLELAVNGWFSYDGTEWTSSVRETLAANWQHLLDNVLAPVDTGDGTRSATLYLPDGDTKTGTIHVERVSLSADGPHELHASIEISIPGGELS